MRIYVASSWRNHLQPEVVAVLREHGHEVYDFKNPAENNSGFGWSQIDPDWQRWSNEKFIEALEHPIADNGFELDADALEWCDVCVCVLPCGRSAHLELGWAAGRGKKTAVLLQYKPNVPLGHVHSTTRPCEACASSRGCRYYLEDPVQLEPELMYKLCDEVFMRPVDLLEWLEEINPLVYHGS